MMIPESKNLCFKLNITAKLERGILRYLTLINFCLGFVVIAVYFFSGNSAHLVQWGVVTVFIWGLFRIIVRDKRFNRYIRGVVMFAYLLLSLVGILSVWSYFTAYGSPFAPFHDDSYFFTNIQSMALGTVPYSFTLYEVVMVPVYWLCNSFNSVVAVQDLLPVNWALGATTVGLATILATKVSRRFSLIAALALIINYNFVDATVHLYRDGFILVLTLLCILCVLSKRYLLSIGFAFLVGLNRGGNGILCFLYIIIIIILHKGLIKKLNSKKTVVVFVGLLLALIILDSSIKLGSMGGGFTDSSKIGEQTIVSRSMSRMDRFLGGDSQGYDSTKLINSLGPLGILAVPLAATFAPVRWNGLCIETDAHVQGFDLGFVRVLRPVMVFMFLTAISWIIIGPLFVDGLLRSIKGSREEFIMGLIFIVTVFAISFVSFQARHRTSFEIFFPMLISLSVCQTRVDRFHRKCLIVFFVGLVYMANLLPYLV